MDRDADISIRPIARPTMPVLPDSLSSAAVMDAGVDATALGEPIRRLAGGAICTGRAVTVRAGSLAQWQALELAEPGDIIVIACAGRRDRAEFGAIYVDVARQKGVAAIVTDGLVRDLDEVDAIGLPVFAAGLHPSSPADPQPGSIGCDIDIHDVTITSGDIMVADGDGVAIVPSARLAELSGALQRQADREASLRGSGAMVPERIRSALASKRIVTHDL